MPEELDQKPKKRSLADRIVGASIVVGIAHLCLKLAGLIQAKAAAQFLENQSYETIFVVAFNGVVFSLFLIGEEVIGPGLLPVFMREMDDNGEEAAWDLASILLSLQTVVLLVLVGLIMCFPQLFIHIFTEWTAESHPDQFTLLRRSLVWLAPCLFFLSVGSTTYILLNGYKRFFLAAFGDASWKICVVVMLVVGIGIFKLDYRALYFGLLFGSAAKLLTHLVGLAGKIRFVRPSFNMSSPAFKAMLLLMLPLVAGIVFAKFRDIFVNIRILTHIEQDGILQANDLGRKLFSAINWVIPFTLQIALFPFLCELVDRKDHEKLGEVLTNSTRLLLAVFIPGAVCLAILGEQVAVGIFLGGKAGLQVALWTGVSTACYVLVLPAAAVECVLMQGFFANRRMVAVTLIGIGCSLLSVIVSAIFIAGIGVRPEQALIVVSLSFVASRFVKSILLMACLKTTVPMLPIGPTSVFVGKLLLLAAIVGAGTFGTQRLLNRVMDDGLAKAKSELVEVTGEKRVRLADARKVDVKRKLILLKCAAGAFAGGLIFLIGALLLRIKEPIMMFTWTWGRVASKIPGLKKG